MDKEGDLDEWLRDDLLVPMITPYISVLKSLPIYFAEWINSINIKEVTPNEDFQKFFKKYDVSCLSFNYTDTVEKVYGHSEVLHIHGRQNEKIYVGHGNNEVFEDESNIVLEGAMLDIRYALKKDTKAILERNKEKFLSMLDNAIQKIFVYGFSFGEVDNIYLSKINEKLPEVEWYVQSYLSEDFSKFRKQLVNIGVEEVRIHHWYNVLDY